MIYFLYGIFLLLLCVAVAVGVVGGTISGFAQVHRERQRARELSLQGKIERAQQKIKEAEEARREAAAKEAGEALQHPERFDSFEKWQQATRPFYEGLLDIDKITTPEVEALYRKQWVEARKKAGKL